MQGGIKAMERQNFHTALQIFDKMIQIAPTFAEGWNKRATVYYLLKNYEASMADIESTLALEPGILVLFPGWVWSIWPKSNTIKP